MARIAPLPRADAPPEIVKRYADTQPGTPAGTLGDWWTTWAHMPAIPSTRAGLAAIGADPV